MGKILTYGSIERSKIYFARNILLQNFSINHILFSESIWILTREKNPPEAILSKAMDALEDLVS